MADNKKSFILYCDIIHTVDKLPIETKGKLFQLILDYVNDKNPDEGKEDLIIQIAFEPIKQQLKRDLRKYETYIDKQRINGLKGGRPGLNNKPKETQKTQPFISKPKKADNVNDNDNDNDNVTGNVIYNIKDELLNSQIWIEEIAIKKKLTPQIVKTNLETFLNDQELTDNLNRDMSDVKRHFINNLNKKIDSNILNKSTGLKKTIF